MWLQAARGYAALLVLFFHAGALAFNDNLAPFFFGHTGVDLFFFISGFIIYRAHQRDFGQPGRLGRYLYKRIARIYPPYWVGTLLILGVMLVAPGIVEEEKQNAGSILESFALFPIAGYEHKPLLPVGWSLFFEMAFYAGVTLLFLIPRRLGPFVWICWGIAAVFFMGWDDHGKGRSTADGVFFFLTGLPALEFLGGVAIAAIKRIPGDPTTWFFGFVFLFLAAASAHGLEARTTLVSVTYAVSHACLLVAIRQLDEKQPPPPPRWLIVLGDQSYAIYLAHFPVIMGVDMILERLTPGLSYWFATILLSIVGLAAGVVFFITVEAPLLKMTRNRYYRLFLEEKAKSP